MLLLQVKNIVIATGGSASRIPIPGAEHAIISDEVGLSQLQRQTVALLDAVDQAGLEQLQRSGHGISWCALSASHHSLMPWAKVAAGYLGPVHASHS